MYQQQFGLQRSFAGEGIAQGDAIFRTAATGKLVSELAVALNRRDSVALLTGPSGTGKSTIAHAVLKELSTCLAFAALSERPLTPHELLEQLLTDFGHEVFDKSHVERRQIWRQFMSEAAATDTQVCLLIEAADSLDVDVLLALHQLTASDASLSSGCNVILTTNHDVGQFLDQPELIAFSQRVRLRRRIEPLSAAEVAQYLEFKSELAGAPRARLFADDVARVAHDLSGGVIRVIDNLLESALASAAADHAMPVTAEDIARISVEQFGMNKLDANEIQQLLESGDDPDIVRDEPAVSIPTLIEWVPDYTPSRELLLGQY